MLGKFKSIFTPVFEPPWASFRRRLMRIGDFQTELGLSQGLSGDWPTFAQLHIASGNLSVIDFWRTSNFTLVCLSKNYFFIFLDFTTIDLFQKSIFCSFFVGSLPLAFSEVSHNEFIIQFQGFPAFDIPTSHTLFFCFPSPLRGSKKSKNRTVEFVKQ